MATTLQLLLRLPPSLRCHTLTPLLHQTPQRNLLNALPRRLFSNTAHNLKRQHAAPKSSSKHTPPRPSPKPTSRLKPRPQAPPPSHTKPQGPQPNTTAAALRTLLDSSPSSRVLLYASPSHTTFYLNSYILGALFLLAGTNIAFFSKTGLSPDGTSMSWKLRALNLVPAFFFVVFSTAFFVGPQKLVRTLSVVRTAAASPGGGRVVLRFEMKHPVPFIPTWNLKRRSGGVIDAPLGEVYMDRSVIASNDSLPQYTVPLARSAEFTEDYYPTTITPEQSPPSSSIFSWLRGFNLSLLNIWPALVRDTRRMFTREGFMYVRIPGHGNWKMDLQDCVLLDEGRAMMECLEVDERFAEGRGVIGWLKERLS